MLEGLLAPQFIEGREVKTVGEDVEFHLLLSLLFTTCKENREAVNYLSNMVYSYMLLLLKEESIWIG